MPTIKSPALAMLRRAGDAGIPSVHSHQFRHAFAYDWLAAGRQAYDLRRLAGWLPGRLSGAMPRPRPTAERARRIVSRPAGSGSDMRHVEHV